MHNNIKSKNKAKQGINQIKGIYHPDMNSLVASNSSSKAELEIHPTNSMSTLSKNEPAIKCSKNASPVTHIPEDVKSVI